MSVDMGQILTRGNFGLIYASTLPFFCKQAEESGHFFDTVIHYFHPTAALSTVPRGVGTRYVGLERIGSMPPPFPKGSAPARVMIVLSSSLNSKSPKSRAQPVYYRTIPQVVTAMGRLLWATFDASRRQGNTEVLNSYPTTTTHIIPSPSDQKRLGTWDVPLSSIKWTSTWPVNDYGGGDSLMETLRSYTGRRTLCIYFFSPAGDPIPNLVDWVPCTLRLPAMSTIAYAMS